MSFRQFKAEGAESEVPQRGNSAWRRHDLLPEASACAVPSAWKTSLQVSGSFLLTFLPVSFHVSLPPKTVSDALDLGQVSQLRHS